MKMQPCDIIFTFKRGNWISELIYFFSRLSNKTYSGFKVSHVGMYVYDNLIAEASFSGVVIRNLKKYDTNKYNVYVGRVKEDYNAQNVVLYCGENAGQTKYAYGQLLAFAVKNIFGLDKIGDVQRSHMMCSEFIMNAFLAGGVNLMEGKKISAMVSPLDLFTSSKIEKTMV